MLLFVNIAIVILLVTLILHYNQHFRLKIGRKNYLTTRRSSIKNRISKISNVINKKSNVAGSSNETHFGGYYCKCVSSNGTTLNLVPMAYLFYVVFQLILCCLTIAVEILNNSGNHDLLPAVESHHSHTASGFHRLHISYVNIYIFILDHILILGIMTLSIWQSLFTYYRFYSTFESARMQTVSTKIVLKRFSLYPIIFYMLFMTQLYLYYWMWPLIIILHYSFNYYYTLKFSRLLITQCQLFETTSKAGDITVNNQELINNVRFMQKVSLICCTLQSISLSAFIIIYNVNVIYHLPLIWSFTSFVFGLNFIRNRLCIKNCMRSCLNCVPDRNKVVSTTKCATDNAPKTEHPIIETKKAEPKNTQKSIALRQAHSETLRNPFPIGMSNFRRKGLSNPVWKIKLIPEEMDNNIPTLEPKTNSAPLSPLSDVKQPNPNSKNKLKAVASHGLMTPTSPVMPPTPDNVEDEYKQFEEHINEYIDKHYDYTEDDDEGFVFTEDTIDIVVDKKSNENISEKKNENCINNKEILIVLEPLERLAKIGFCSQTNIDLFAEIVISNHKYYNSQSHQTAFWNGSSHTVHGHVLGTPIGPLKKIALQNIRSTSDPKDIYK